MPPLTQNNQPRQSQFNTLNAPAVNNQGKLLSDCEASQNLMSSAKKLGLSTDQCNALSDLAKALGPEATKDLKVLLERQIGGKSALLDVDFPPTQEDTGSTLLANLIRFYNSTLAKSEEKDKIKFDLNADKIQIISDFIKELAHPPEITQEQRGTCAPTVVHHYAVLEHPAELTKVYLRLITNKISGTASGGLLFLIPDSIPGDGTGRSLNERVITSALLHNAARVIDPNKNWQYSNKEDAFIIVEDGKIVERRPTGQYPEEIAYSAKSVLGSLDTEIQITNTDTKKERGAKLTQARTLLLDLEENPSDPDFTCLAVRWPTSKEEKNPGYHAILALYMTTEERKIDTGTTEEEWLVFRNPQGVVHRDNDNRIEPVEGAAEGTYRMPIGNLGKDGSHELLMLIHKEYGPINNQTDANSKQFDK